MKKLTLILTALTLNPLVADANNRQPNLSLPASVCPAIRPIAQGVEGCEQNHLFAQAAANCLSSLDVTAKKIGLDMSKIFQLGKTKAQDADFKETAAEYFKMTRLLDYMIEVTELARIEVAAYMEHMVLPEDDGETLEEDMEIACFGDNMEALEAIGQRLDRKQTEFESALDATAKLLMASQGRKTNLGAIGGNTAPAPAARPSPQAAPKGPQGKGWGKSDISGTEDQKQKRLNK